MSAPLAQVKQMGFKDKQPLFRVVGTDGQPLMTRDHNPIDGGGYKKEWLGRYRADSINDYYADRNRGEE